MLQTQSPILLDAMVDVDFTGHDLHVSETDATMSEYLPSVHNMHCPLLRLVLYVPDLQSVHCLPDNVS